MKDDKRNIWARRLALQIATQLPESENDALEVLRCARDLVMYVSQGQREIARTYPLTLVHDDNRDGL